MLKAVFCFLVVLSSLSCFSQPYWAYVAGSYKQDEATDICQDNAGNLISTGYFSDQVIFNYLANIQLTPASSGIPDIYISKSDPAGQCLWATKAGGAGTDQALSVATDSQGNLYITGYYSGSATFGSITLNAVGGSQDGFIAMLDANGNFVWATSFGGPLTEQGTSIAIDNLGNLVVTGQFQGACNFGATALNSMLNPLTGFPSADIFIAKYTGTGIPVWAKQGKAKYDDKGMDIITDPANNIYVCGQFSDTIQFQNTYANVIMNASFVIKYNASGQEQWFRKIAGLSSTANSITIDSYNKLYLAGDFLGTLTYFGSSGNNQVSGLYSNKAFLLKIDHNGSFIWGKSESSNSYVSGKRVAIDAQQDPYLFGEFGCTMKEYSDAYGPGIFNSIGFKDLFITKYSSGAIRQWFRQFGGPKNDRALGLVMSGINEPVMAGSFEAWLNMPYTWGSTNLPFPYQLAGDQPDSICGAPLNYNHYYYRPGMGYSDLFITKGVDLSRNPYDYYQRSGSSCNLDFVGSCITCALCSNPDYACRDTIEGCETVSLGCNTHATSSSTSYIAIGPMHTYTWSANPSNITVSGPVTLNVSTLDGCYASSASVYVQIHPVPPPPVISDSYSVNILQPQNTAPITICGTDTITFTGGNVRNTTYTWSGPYLSAHDSVAIANQSGTYIFEVTDAFGCTNRNNITISFNDSLPDFGPKQKNDTLRICSGIFDTHIICDSITNPMLTYPYNCVTTTGRFLVSASPGLTVVPIYLPTCDLSTLLSATATGNYTYTIGYFLNNLCMDDTIYFTGHVHIIVKPVPGGDVMFSGGGDICPGDSALITLINVSILTPNTTYTLSPPGSYWAHGGLTGFTLYTSDTISGCTNIQPFPTDVTVKPMPFIIPFPNSLLCPNDSVIVYTNYAVALLYEWHGPAGIIPGNNQYQSAHIPGPYYCIVTDSGGCVFTTNVVEIKQYTTPYLTSSPKSVMCNNEPLTLHVSALDSTQISWHLPLSGYGTTRTISSPGVYSCDVTMCGFTQSLSITILGSSISASISATGPTTLCPFDSVLLSGIAPGAVSYLWYPTGSPLPDYLAYDAGDYTFEATNNDGCVATASIQVAFTSTVSPPVLAVNDTICAGQAASLSATATGNTLHWFGNSSGGQVIATGPSYTTPLLNAQTTYYVASVNGNGCHSVGIPVTAYILPSSQAPEIICDSLLCNRDTLKLFSPFLPGASYHWSGPGISNVTTNSVMIPHPGMNNTGTYSLYISGSGCTSKTSTVGVTVVNIQAPVLSGRDSVCANSAYYALVNPADPGNTYTWSGPNGFSSNNDSLIFAPALPNQSGTYTVNASQSGCISTPGTLHVIVLDLPPLLQISSNSPICAGDNLSLAFSPAASYPVYWSGPNGFTSAQNPITLTASVAHNGTYSVAMRNAFCQGPTATHSVQVLAYPQLRLGNDTVACDDEAVMLTSSSSFPAYLWSNGAVTAAIIVSQSGTYKVTSANGKCVASDSIKVDIISCNFSIPNIFSPNGDGSNDLFQFRSAAIKDLHCEIWDRWGLKMAEFSGAENGWNGWNIYTNKPCSDGTYFYVASVTNVAGVQKVLRGFITLVR